MGMEILLWLVPAAVATLVAMVWVGVIGRRLEREDRTVSTPRQQQRFAAAIQRQTQVRTPRRAPVERSTGVATRRQSAP